MSEQMVDVCVVGAGVAGIACAQGLAQQGATVVLLDRLHPMPDCLKAEKIGGEGVQAMLRLGFGDAVNAALTPLRNVSVFIGERSLGALRLDPPEAGMLYHDFVNALRGCLDRQVCFRPGTKATAFEQQPDSIRVVTDKGERIACRLVVMATGDARHLLEPLGATHEPQMPHQTFAAAFSMKGILGEQNAPDDSQTYHRPIVGAPIAYATFFRLGVSSVPKGNPTSSAGSDAVREGSLLRANIFCPGEFTKSGDEKWQRDLKQRPLELLSEGNCLLAAASRSWSMASPVAIRKVQVSRLQPPSVPRIVVLGDAAHTIDPSGGGGLTFSLLEAELLLNVYVPRWLAANDCSQRAIATFYADPRRVSAVRRFFSRGEYIFALNHDPSMQGKSLRLRFALQHIISSRTNSPPGRQHRGAGTHPWQIPTSYLYEQQASATRNWRERLIPSGEKRSM